MNNITKVLADTYANPAICTKEVAEACTEYCRKFPAEQITFLERAIESATYFRDASTDTIKHLTEIYETLCKSQTAEQTKDSNQKLK